MRPPTVGNDGPSTGEGQPYWGPAIVSRGLLPPAPFCFSPRRSLSAAQSSLAAPPRGWHLAGHREIVLPQLLEQQCMGPSFPNLGLRAGIWGAALSSRSRARLFTHGALWTLIQWFAFLASLGRVVWHAGLGRLAGNRSRERQWLPARGKVAVMIRERVHCVPQLFLQLRSYD